MGGKVRSQVTSKRPAVEGPVTKCKIYKQTDDASKKEAKLVFEHIREKVKLFGYIRI